MNGGDAPFAYSGLERIFHERGRLAVCTCLVANPNGMRFTELQDACALTDGNLNRHLHALAEVGVVEMERVTGRGRPATTVRITAVSRRATSQPKPSSRIQALPTPAIRIRMSRLLPETGSVSHRRPCSSERFDFLGREEEAMPRLAKHPEVRAGTKTTHVDRRPLSPRSRCRPRRRGPQPAHD